MAEQVDYGPRLGADPELFVMNSTSAKVVPICGLVGGSKEAPIPVLNQAIFAEPNPRWLKGAIGNFAYQEDNVMFEFNIPACPDIRSFTAAIAAMVDYSEIQLLNPKGLSFKYANTQKFSPAELEANPQAMTMGCLPDFDAYKPVEEQQREPFSPTEMGTRRFCGGHLHVQYNKNNCPPWVFAQLMDLVVSLPFLSWDKQGDRRNFYGKPGIFREKPYGIEYRTPSNFWLKKEFRDNNLYAMGENCFQLADYANRNSKALQLDYSRVPWKDVHAAVAEEDTKAAVDIIEFIQRQTALYINSGNGVKTKKGAQLRNIRIPGARAMDEFIENARPMVRDMVVDDGNPMDEEVQP